MTVRPNRPCPCGRPRRFDQCCQPYLAGVTLPPDPESLMRSRYSAFVSGDAAYLNATWHARTRPQDLDLADNPRWTGLCVVRSALEDADHGTVEFIARYKLGGRAHQLHEISRFERIDGHWYYVDGQLLDD